jgi:hypothetical protein
VETITLNMEYAAEEVYRFLVYDRVIDEGMGDETL